MKLLRNALRVITATVVLAGSAEMPKGCDHVDDNPKTGGPAHQPDIIPLPTNGTGRLPNRTPQRKRKVEFQATWIPARDMTVSYAVSTDSNVERHAKSPWVHVSYALPGDHAALTVENHGVGGFLQCTIMIDGKILLPSQNHGHSSYEHRNDAGDCKVSAIVP